MLDLSKSAMTYRNAGPGDVLHLALKINERPSRARGIGVNAPHNRAFQLTKEEKQWLRQIKRDLKHDQIVESVKKQPYS